MDTISGIQVDSTAVILYNMILGCFHTKIKLRSFIQQRFVASHFYGAKTAQENLLCSSYFTYESILDIV